MTLPAAESVVILDSPHGGPGQREWNLRDGAGARLIQPVETLADLLHRLGDVPLERIRANPAPGVAVEEDLLVDGCKLCELIDGTLVEKPVGYYESLLAAVLIRLLGNFVEEHKLGIVLAPDATLKLAPGLMRLPDVSFLSSEHFPDHELPAEPLLPLAPDLAVEVLISGNTPAEIRRTLEEFFAAGTKLAWVADPDTRTVTVYTGPDSYTTVAEDGVLDGGDLLPGFRLGVAEWFSRTGKRKQAAEKRERPARKVSSRQAARSSRRSPTR